MNIDKKDIKKIEEYLDYLISISGSEQIEIIYRGKGKWDAVNMDYPLSLDMSLDDLQKEFEKYQNI